MKIKLFTQNTFLGLLITLVLMFSLQSPADALKFSRSSPSSSGDLQRVFANQDFRISFSVSSGSNTTAIKDVNGKLIKDSTSTGGGADHRIDSSGYLVEDIGNTEYREITTDPTGTLVIDPRPRLSSEGTAGSPNATYYVDASKNVVDADGKPVYVQTGDGTADSPWSYTRAKADPTAKVPDANRYHYNEEALQITVSTGLTLKKINSYTVNLTANHTMNEAKNSVNEDRISSSISLTYTASAVGTYDITISDTTPASDRPGVAAPDLVFRVFVVKDIGAVLNQATTFESGRDGVEYGYDTQDWQLNEDDDDTIGYFDFGTEDAPVTYSVEGSGRVYIKLGDRVTSLTKTLHTSSDAPVYLDMSGGTNRVTAYVAGNTGRTAIFIFSGATQDKYPRIEITQGHNQVGAAGGRLEQYLEVKVSDGRRSAIPGVAVHFATTAAGAMFIPVPGTTVYGNSLALLAALPDPMNTATYSATATTPPKKGSPVFIQTDRSGLAKVYYELGTDTSQTITATLPGDPFTTENRPTIQNFTARLGTTGSERVANLEILSGDPQSGEKGKRLKEPLVVIARSTAEYRIPNVVIQFTTSIGTLSRAGLTQGPLVDDDDTLIWGEIPANTPNPDSGQQIYVRTGSDGQASVNYEIGQFDIARQVSAEIRHEPLDTDYSFAIKRVTFNINGSGSGTPTPPAPPETPVDLTTPFTVSTTSITGAPGSTQTLTITAPTLAQVGNIVFGEFLNAGGSASPSSGTGTFTSTLTLPNTEGEYDLIVAVGSDRRTVTVTVSSAAAAAQATGQLTLTSTFSGAPGSQSTVTVKATHADGTAASGVSVSLSVTSGGGAFSPATVTTGTNGTATSTFTRGTTAGTNYFITASASDYDSVQQRISITGTPPGSIPPPTGAAGEADAIDVYDGDNQRGTPNTRLAEPLVVEVVDANDDAVANERVEFRTTRGIGRFSPSRPRTNANGLAQTRFTPTSSGTIRIAASVEGVASRAVFTITAGAPAASLTKVSGDSQSGTPGNALTNPFVVEVKDADGETIEGIPVTFSVTAGGGSLSETSATTNANGRASTTLTLGSRTGVNSVQASVPGVDPVTFSTSIEPKVLVAAANRPVLYWSDGGTVYQLAGATTTKVAESVNGFAVGGGKVYWTTQTGPSAGSIHSANLDGTGATTLNSIMAVPMGIAVDTANSKLYWTNSRGRVQSGNLNGKSIQNLVQNRTSPTDLVLGGGYIYWIEDGNSIRRAPMTGQRTVTDVAVNLDTVGGLAVGGSKVYWTEQTGASSGTVNGADLDGTNFSTLATLLAAPMGIAVDTAGGKLYWTNSRGRVQSANRDGSKIRNVVEGLISPSKLVIGGANTAVVAQQQPTKPASTAKDTSAYDVNGDGTVDNIDAGLVADALGTSNAKYDVNGDGTVNFLDLLLVFDNRDETAGSPPLVGLKMTATQVEVLQEQIDLLIATNDRSPAAMRTLVYLQQLLATARPEKTQLLANYPNPFNPETWIPYTLATDTEVRLTIYDAQGVVIRTLQIGHQAAGVLHRSRTRSVLGRSKRTR